jgi:hypothetical protein
MKIKKSLDYYKDLQVKVFLKKGCQNKSYKLLNKIIEIMGKKES